MPVRGGLEERLGEHFLLFAHFASFLSGVSPAASVSFAAVGNERRLKHWTISR
jgi:hypothetical protein